VSDIDTAAADGLKVLDPKLPIREADVALQRSKYSFWANSGHPVERPNAK
jgi:hypothetical protein